MGKHRLWIVLAAGAASTIHNTSSLGAAKPPPAPHAGKRTYLYEPKWGCEGGLAALTPHHKFSFQRYAQ